MNYLTITYSHKFNASIPSIANRRYVHTYRRILWNKILNTSILFILFLGIPNHSSALENCELNNHTNKKPTSFCLNIETSFDRLQDPIPEMNEVTIPLKRSGHLFMIDAKIDGVEGNLLFDTGASAVTLNINYFRNHLHSKDIAGSGISGSVAESGEIMVDTLNVDCLRFTKQRVSTASLSHLENTRKIKILGLFGLSLLKNFEIVFMPSMNQLKLIKIDSKGNRLNNQNEPTEKSIDIDFKNNIVYLEGKINGRRLNFCFDTGAECNVLDNNLSKSVLSMVTIKKRSTLKGAGDQTVEILSGELNNIIIGNKDQNNQKVILTSLSKMSEAYGVSIDGMLGYDFFYDKIITINLRKETFSYIQVITE
ncbi:MAG: aspartyl protease family protein [Sphingobacteriia bacterium]|nr:aspartyl protease family protein [Sphingobacteriia bacterium]